MAGSVARYFKFDQLQTNYRQEIVGGLTTFVTMAYVLIVHPKILQAAGIPLGPSMVATVLTAFIGTLAMGVYARRPFAIAPYMGENAFVAFTVVKVLGHSWQSALGAIFIGGVLFTLVSAFRIRGWLASAIPESLKIAFAVGIGLFLTFVGLNHTGIVALGAEGAPVRPGNFHDPAIYLALACFLLICFFMIRKIKGAMLLGILVITAIAFATSVAEPPTHLLSLPPSLEPLWLALDIKAAFTWGFFSVILTVFVMDFVDTTGTLLGLSYKSGLLDKEGNLPEMEKPMMVDSTMTVVGSLLGTTTSGIYLESAAGIEAGGRSGFSAVVTALLFLAALFFAPFFTAVPACAYGPALMVVGLLMLSPIAKLKFDDLTEVVPAFCVIILMCFTFHLGMGLTAGFVSYPIMKVFAGRYREVPPGMWVMGALGALFFVFYPY